jgi:hypothetical protein
MSKDLKFGVGFLFLTGMIVSGCLGYSIKDNEEKNRVELVREYQAKESSCMRMMYQMGQMTNRVHFKEKSKKQIAIERMQRN